MIARTDQPRAPWTPDRRRVEALRPRRRLAHGQRGDRSGDANLGPRAAPPRASFTRYAHPDFSQEAHRFEPSSHPHPLPGADRAGVRVRRLRWGRQRQSSDGCRRSDPAGDRKRRRSSSRWTSGSRAKKAATSKISLSGPFQSESEAELPELDLQATAEGTVDGEDIDFDGGLTLLGGNKAYLGYEGTEYEVDPTTFGFVKSMLKKQGGGQGSEASACTDAVGKLKISDFIENLNEGGSAEVGDTSTTKVSGDLNASAALDTISELIEDPACSEQLKAAGPLPSTAELDAAKSTVQDSVKDAHVDLYVGDDHIVRQISAQATIEPPAGSDNKGVKSVDVDLDMELTGVNEEQTISAPAVVEATQRPLPQAGDQPDRTARPVRRPGLGRARWPAGRPQQLRRLIAVGAAAPATLAAVSRTTSNACRGRTRRPRSRTALGCSSSRFPPHSIWLALPADAADSAGGGAGLGRRGRRHRLRHLGARHHSHGGADGPRHRGAGGALGARHRRPAQRHLRQRAGADHRPLRPQSGAARGGQGLDHRLDHRQHPARARRGDAGRRDRPREADLQPHERQRPDLDAAACRRRPDHAGDLRAGRGQGPASARRGAGPLRLEGRAPLAGGGRGPDPHLRRRALLLAQDPPRHLQPRVRRRRRREAGRPASRFWLSPSPGSWSA